ncbi:hypothetical protein DV711_01625 [Motiliproteus coralliicola]|uniref:Uncharacterized protein n=1 Tax=Motiliproteus coralliicola TaxID=2283196 RepID=A0A369WXT5_9GAMM|nr:hypothetical protein [Motiliproteus coralliicola]RDE24315.1 hypothetical protein DV711_01625 [Motiliproteus coralliicola]
MIGSNKSPRPTFLAEVVILGLLAFLIVHFFIDPQKEADYQIKSAHGSALIVQLHLHKESQHRVIELADSFTPEEMLEELETTMSNAGMPLNSQFEQGSNGYALELSSRVILGQSGTEILDPKIAEAASKKRLAQLKTE